jgi:hypothetical protein
MSESGSTHDVSTSDADRPATLSDLDRAHVWFWTARRPRAPSPVVHASDILGVPILVLCGIFPNIAAATLYASLVTLVFSLVEAFVWTFYHVSSPYTPTEHFWAYVAPAIGLAGHLAWCAICFANGAFGTVDSNTSVLTSIALLAVFAFMAAIVPWAYVLTPAETVLLLVASTMALVAPAVVVPYW